jgi:hypothetical protein
MVKVRAIPYPTPRLLLADIPVGPFFHAFLLRSIDVTLCFLVIRSTSGERCCGDEYQDYFAGTLHVLSEHPFHV